MSLAELLTAETIAAYCDGATARPRDVGDRAIAADSHCQTVGIGSISNIAKLSIKILQHIDPAVDVSALEVLVAHAEAEGKERARVRNASTPSFAVFHDAAARHGTERTSWSTSRCVSSAPCRCGLPPPLILGFFTARWAC